MDKYECSSEPMEPGQEYSIVYGVNMAAAARAAALREFEGGDGDSAFAYVRPFGSDSAGDLYEFVVSVEMTARFRRAVPAKKEAENG